MAGSTVIVSITGNPEVLDQLPPDILERITEELSDLSPVLEPIIELMQETQRENFGDQGATYDDPWAPLAKSTIREKQRLGYGGKPPLVREGTLEAAIGSNVTRDGDNGASVGVDLEAAPYAAYLHYGAEQNNLPARVLVAISSDEVEQIQQRVNEYLTNAGIPANALIVEANVES